MGIRKSGSPSRTLMDSVFFFCKQTAAVFCVVVLLVLGLTACSKIQAEYPREGVVFTNPIAQNGNDPWVVFHEGLYYYCYAANNGVSVAAFHNLYELEQARGFSVWLAPENTRYAAEIWAPELHYLNGEWYIYVAADDGDNSNHRMYVLKGSSQNPTDPFVFVGQITDSTDRWAIDGTVLQLNGKLYFVWSGWEGDVNEAQLLYIAAMSDPCTISGERVCISAPEYAWERKGKPYVNEGPTALYRNDKTYIVYSASGSWLDAYCLGLLTYKGGDPLDKDAWDKDRKPVFKKGNGVYGPGHCSFTTSPDGSETWCVYHANPVAGSGWSGRTVCTQKIVWDKNDRPVFGKPIGFGVEMTMVKNPHGRTEHISETTEDVQNG